ncbi:plasmid replication initiator TrfA (plasmid) [Arsenophonus nasoniae]|uniref:plasmid replication initiator TrfA n=1 Tax=Arsenophonus nasoniae TaxID=638 RepID=UPI0024688342|nr:plasmid replication initiator TrfA [Arsenophonus nasoniae]WGM13883.1 plasmid replication initiator TrfA [Arsenophonus nasoniae]WGM18495.1 plasmid replication initiator TrfA [Arsenophonus nasoniae]
MKNIWERTQNIANKIAEKNLVKETNKSTDGGGTLFREIDKNTDTNFRDIDKEIYLPVAKKSRTPVPNIILRSALFGLVAKGTRKYEKNILKATVNGYTIKYTGEQLDQSDLDVWLECLQRCQQSPLGHTVRFSSYKFLKSIERNTGKSQYQWLHESLNRMKANAVQLSDKKYTYIGSLINEIYRDDKTGENCLILNPKIADFFGDSGWTGITKALRLKLKGKPLTQWLYGFYISHAKPLPIKVITLRELCGSEIKELKKFKQLLKKSLLELSDVTDWHCEIDTKDKVIVSKK